MLKIKLFRAFAWVVVLFAVLSGVIGVRTIHGRVIQEAQTRVRLNLSSAWAQMDAAMRLMEVSLSFAAAKPLVVEACQSRQWGELELRRRLEQIRVQSAMHFLALVSSDGVVVLRTTPPHATGDIKLGDAAVSAALKGTAKTCFTVLSRTELAQEAAGLEDRAFLELEDTPRARRSPRKEETRGLAVVSAVPVLEGGRVLAVLYGGVLLNRNNDLVDRISDVIFRNEQYEGVPVGTATIFLGDGRIATTVKRENGNRALGTRVSREVAERVLDSGEPWVGEAFVVKDWYLTAYEPIRDGSGAIVGMLYVGTLKRPYVDSAHSLALRFVFLSLFVLLVALILSFMFASGLANPIHRLVEASNRMARGERAPPVPATRSCAETDALIRAFNQMADTLAEREEKLKALNRSYMETLGFVSHELKGPVATIMNYVYLLKEGKMGRLDEKQAKAVKSIDVNSARLLEMVRHYLNLSRIENGEWSPVATRVDVLSEIVRPLLDATEADIAAKGMKVENRVPGDVALHADLNMTREVFENLLHNAVKYGRSGGLIRLACRSLDGKVEFAVGNEGEGIPADKIGTLFQKFSRVEGAATRGQRGTGLGLFITRHIVEAHGGRIEAQSKPNEWTEFRFTLPAERDEAKGNGSAA